MHVTARTRRSVIDADVIVTGDSLSISAVHVKGPHTVTRPAQLDTLQRHAVRREAAKKLGRPELSPDWKPEFEPEPEPEPASPSDLIDTHQASRILGRSMQTVRSYIYSGVLDSLSPAGEHYLWRDEVEALREHFDAGGAPSDWRAAA